eukprot:Platyproteum_vivax@DN6277_c0_g1_i8.p1
MESEERDAQYHDMRRMGVYAGAEAVLSGNNNLGVEPVILRENLAPKGYTQLADDHILKADQVALKRFALQALFAIFYVNSLGFTGISLHPDNLQTGVGLKIALDFIVPITEVEQLFDDMYEWAILYLFMQNASVSSTAFETAFPLEKYKKFRLIEPEQVVEHRVFLKSERFPAFLAPFVQALLDSKHLGAKAKEKLTAKQVVLALLLEDETSLEIEQFLIESDVFEPEEYKGYVPITKTELTDEELEELAEKAAEMREKRQEAITTRNENYEKERLARKRKVAALAKLLVRKQEELRLKRAAEKKAKRKKKKKKKKSTLR